MYPSEEQKKSFTTISSLPPSSPFIRDTCTSWFDFMTCSYGSAVWLCNKCLVNMYTLSPTYELQISKALLEVGWERRQRYYASYHKYHISWEKGIHHQCLGEDLEIPQKRELRESHTRNLWVLFENLQKLQNYSWSKSKKYGAWLDRSILQLLKTQVTVTSPMVKGKISKF